MKKLLSGLLSAMLVISLAGCGSSFKAGTYEGSVQGFNGTVKVNLTINENKEITDIKTESTESPDIGEPAIDLLVDRVIEGNTLDVDVITSATVSSKAFLAACEAALKAAGLKATDLKKVEGGNTSVTDETKATDVVIIGAGGAGMTAAITAAQAGKKVIIVEKAEIVGGNSSKATGGMNASETSFQDKNVFEANAAVEKTIAAAKKDYPELKDLIATVEKQYNDYKANPEGYFDSNELFMLDTLVGGKNVNDFDLVKTLVENSADAITWLSSLTNAINLTDVASFGGASVKRIHRPVDENGKTISVGSYMIPLLEKNCKDLGIEIITGTTAKEIIMTEGTATGIKTSSSKVNYTINAQSVIIATGGFGANLDMVVDYKPELEGFITTNAPTITGDGIAMAQTAGANVVDMKQIQIHPTVHQETAALITEGLRGDGAILVNQEGKRFCDEVGTRDAVSAAELAQTGGYAYLIVDQKMVDASSVIAGYIKKNLTIGGGEIADLAKAIGCDATTLQNTMDAWNACIDAKEDKEFGRTSFANKLDTAPYYAIKIAPGVHHTMGGVEINTNAEVIDTKGNVIPGLFAAGEVTGGVHGANRLGGNAVADFTVFGRIAGASAAAFVK